MAKFEKLVNGDFESIISTLENDILRSGVSMNLVDESNYQSGGTKVAVRVYDKYFMRNGNRASLSLTVAGADRSVFIAAIGAGGGSGVFLNFSLGAETELTDLVADSVRRMGL
ncbi:DUF6054 family protein [Caproicibacter sp.]|uniref:DUF6054 family protein n=1 Tax=Caproicibacter sp. TaxID=2814884 RepID=UPI003989E025